MARDEDAHVRCWYMRGLMKRLLAERIFRQAALRWLYWKRE